MHIAVIGMGNMGSAIAEGLLAAGHEVTVYNRTASKAAPLVERGAALANSAADAISRADLSVVVLFDEASTRQVLLDPAVQVVLPGRRLINVAATTPDEIVALAADVAAKGGELAEVNVTVYPDLVRTRTAHFIVASDAGSADDWVALFANLGPRVHHVGAVGNASRTELALWFSYMFHSVAAAYSAAAAKKLGLPQDVVTSNLTENPTLRVASAQDLLPQMFARRYTKDTWSVDNMVASLDMIIDFGRSIDLPVAILDQIRSLYAQAQERGFGDSDTAAVVESLYT